MSGDRMDNPPHIDDIGIARHADRVRALSDLKVAVQTVPALREWVSGDFFVTTYDNNIFALCGMTPDEFSRRISSGISLADQEADRFYELYERYRMVLVDANNDSDTVIKKGRPGIIGITRFDKKEIVEEWEYLLREYKKCAPYVQDHLGCIYIDSHVPVADPDGGIAGYWDVVILVINSPVCHSALKFYKAIDGDGGLYDVIRIDILVMPMIHDCRKTLRRINGFRNRLGDYRDPYGEERTMKNIVYIATEDEKYKKFFEKHDIRYI